MGNRLESDRPAFYHIEVQGALSSRWSDYMGGVKVSVKYEQGVPYTILEGAIQFTLLFIPIWWS